MATTFDTINDIFFKRVTEDPDFFGYTNVPDSEVQEIIDTKAFDYMIESIASIFENTTPTIDFNDYNTTTEEFNFDMTNSEIQMIVNLMFEKFMSRDLAKLKIYNKFFTSNEISTFSPSADRRTFVEMLDGLKDKNIKAIKSYGSRDRLTNKLISYSDVSY